jgi:hypothetical protein
MVDIEIADERWTVTGSVDEGQEINTCVFWSFIRTLKPIHLLQVSPRSRKQDKETGHAQMPQTRDEIFING